MRRAAFYPITASADAAECRAGDERHKHARAVDILAQRIVPAADGLARAEVNALEHELLAADPEEHDRRKQCAQRADINGHDVHPLRHDGLNTQRDGKPDHMDHRRGRHALEAEPLLQGRDRSLIEVDDRRDAREGHADEKHHRHDAAARHAVHDMDEVDEHQAGAAGVELRAARRHGGNDDERRQQRCDRIKERHIARRARDALAPAEVRAVDDAAVARNGQREKRLTERIDPDVGIEQALGLDGEDVPIAVRRAGQRGHIDAQPHKQQKQNRHHDLIRLFNAAGDAERHDDKAHRDRDHDPDIRAPRAGGGVEAADDSVHVLPHGGQAAVKRQERILEDPAHDAGVADGQRQRAEHRDIADQFAGPALAPARLGAHAESVDRPRAGCAAERELPDDAGGADENDKQKIRQQEGHAAPLGHQRRKAPDVAHADGRADAGDDEAAAAAKAVAFADVGVVTHNVVSFHALRHKLV